MSTEGLIIALTMVVITSLWIAAPLLLRKLTSPQDQHAVLLSTYKQLLSSIHELDDDYASGKIDAAYYQTEREGWMQHGIQMLVAIDKLDKPTKLKTAQ